jgi:hypothetical protein
VRSIGLRLVALPVLAFAFFVAYTHSLPFAESLLPAANEVGVGLFIAAIGIITITLALAWGLVFALPIVWLYRRHAVVVTVVCIAPLLIVICARYLDRPSTSLLAQLPTLFFLVSLAVIVPALAYFLYRILQRTDERSA